MRLPFALLLAGSCADVWDVEQIDLPAPDPCNPDAQVPPTIVLGGQFLDTTNNAPIEGLSINANPGGVAPTDAMGRFAIVLDTAGFPAYLSLIASGNAAYPTHEIYYQRPFVRDPSDGSNKLLPTFAIDSLYESPRAPDRATALISIRNCADEGVDRVTVETEPAATIVYQGGGTATNGTGVGYALNVPSGAVTVRAGRAAEFELAVEAGEMAIVYLVAP